MRVFFDTEFTGLHQKTTLISIGLVAENDRSFYAEFNDYNQSQVDDWIRDNVIANLVFPATTEVEFRQEGKHVSIKHNKETIASRLSEWLTAVAIDGGIEMWSDCLAYDWVLFCNLFGGAFKIPKSVYYIPFDIATFLRVDGADPDVNREKFARLEDSPEKVKHNALWDARVIKACYERLME